MIVTTNVGMSMTTNVGIDVITNVQARLRMCGRNFRMHRFPRQSGNSEFPCTSEFIECNVFPDFMFFLNSSVPLEISRCQFFPNNMKILSFFAFGSFPNLDDIRKTDDIQEKCAFEKFGATREFQKIMRFVTKKTCEKILGWRGVLEKNDIQKKSNIWWEFLGYTEIPYLHVIRDKRDIRKFRPHSSSRPHNYMTATFVVIQVRHS